MYLPFLPNLSIMPSVTTSSPPSTIATLFAQQQQRSLTLRHAPVADRIIRLRRLKGWIRTHRLDIQEAAINECIMQFSHPNLPFGGVNYGGIGKAGGHHGFLAFSNEKSVFRQLWGNKITRFLLPPVSAKMKERLGWVIRNF